MANTILTIDMITRECLRLAHEKAAFIGTINRQFDDSFGDAGAKIGDTLRIRYPSMYTRRSGSRVMNVQDSVQISTALTVATQDGVDMRFNSRELSLDLDEFSQIHLNPAMATLISNIESDVIQGCMRSTANFAGTAGTAISSLTVPGQARTRLNQNLAPKGDRSIQVNSGAMASLVSGTAAYFNPSGAISEQFREGLIARTAMADYYENERVWGMPNSSDVAGGLDGYTITNGDADLTVSSFATPTAGMVFTIGTGTTGVYDCHPETKAGYSQLKQFTILEGSTATNLLISPPIYLTGPKQNVARSTGAALQVSACSGAVFTCLGDASSTYPQALMYHKDAFTFATAELPLMADASKCSRMTKDGLSLRVWQGSDIRNDEVLTRIDILYGYAAIRPAWACRVIGVV